MTILFAPSEGKRPGGSLPPVDASAFCFPELYSFREEAMERYNRFVAGAPAEAVKKLFGVKEEKLVGRYRTDLFAAPTMKAVERYDGVAYDYLDYPSLKPEAKAYVDERLIIFSNLFGPVCAKDRLPDYKLKQGEQIGDFAPEAFYKAHFSDPLDGYLESRGPIVDLRAGFYEKFYKLRLPYLTMKFLKNGRTVSHWAKAYRGIVLRQMAQNGIETEEALLAMDLENLVIEEVKTVKNRKEIVYSIVA
ncbi:YaaA family protein [Hydrogenimonas sp. SS33]|uniref:YaaA family protein n=1 Tax=Hydrogenimonas leucolamina TaxID=2954236 RepID=UPI00336C0275